LRTDKTGAVVIETDGNVLDVQTARTMRLRYWSSSQEVEPLATATGAFDAQP